MLGTCAKTLERVHVQRRPVAHVTGETVARMTFVEFVHQPVAVYLCDDRRRRDGTIDRIAVYQRLLAYRHTGYGTRIDEQEIGFRIQRRHGPPHGFEGSLKDIHSVDFQRAHLTDSDRHGLLSDRDVQALTGP